MAESILLNKAEEFAVKLVGLHKYLVAKQREREIAGQIKRSGTAIGALVCEATYAESSADFIHKLKIALKECHETEYWLNLLYRTEYIAKNEYDILYDKNMELKRMLIASINTRTKGDESKD